jgi:aromatic ring-opening dioxygenase catalytic subunit (LigB family)
MTAVRQPALFVGHGAADRLVRAASPTRAWMERFGATLRARSPRGVLCISSHFVASSFTVTTAETPAIVGLEGRDAPPLAWRPSGSVALARSVMQHLLHARLDPKGDPSRGLDHGAWLPLSLLCPQADVPVVELSLHRSLDPEAHFALGRVLQPLRDEGILIVGSGSLSYDRGDLERLSSDEAAVDVLGAPSKRFQDWVVDIVTQSAPYARGRGLTRFRDHPDAHAVHPTGAHFLPLLVVAGAASAADHGPGVLVHAGSQRGLSMAAFLFE